MFTGIITNLGKFKNKNKSVFTFSADRSFCQKLNPGDSIAVNGICLTIFKKPDSCSFSIEIMPETMNKTMLGFIKVNDLINLELPATPTTFLSGHIVSGHIDGVTELEKITKIKNSYILQFSLPVKLSKYLVEKGSITLNGISLTIIKVNKNSFTVGIIPYTWDNTVLHTIKIGNFVNIEVDILAKYMERLLQK